ncbi:hypothetical protein EON64_17615 [archaeon]|nr:MAG: hypothetical protein EON64_17615 [archaeon]
MRCANCILLTLFPPPLLQYTEKDDKEFKLLLPHEIIVARVAVPNTYFDMACQADTYLAAPAEYNLYIQVSGATQGWGGVCG